MPIKMIKPARLPPDLALLSGLKILMENLLYAWPSEAHLEDTMLGILASQNSNAVDSQILFL